MVALELSLRCPLARVDIYRLDLDRDRGR